MAQIRKTKRRIERTKVYRGSRDWQEPDQQNIISMDAVLRAFGYYPEQQK